MVFSILILAALSFSNAFDPNLWTPYDEATIAEIVGLPTLSDIRYDIKPFRLSIKARDGYTLNMSPEAIQKLFSVYLNYTEYNYIERVHAVTLETWYDQSGNHPYDVTLPDDAWQPLYYLNSTNKCQPSGTQVDITNGFANCGTIGSEQCVNPGGNYALYNDGGSAAVGYSFYPGCEVNGDPTLTIFLAPNMFSLGTWGRGYFSQNYINCATGELSNNKVTGTDKIVRYLAPYSYISPYSGNEEIADDGTYYSMGYCEQSSSGVCFQPYWL